MMEILILGVAIFFGVHLVSSAPRLRAACIDMAGGETSYRGIYSVISLVGFGLMIAGFAYADRVIVREVSDWARDLSHPLMLASLILLAAANMGGYIRKFTRHPMSLGILLWACLHYFANDDLASVWLFGSFGLYAIYSALSAELRGKMLGDGSAALKYDLFAVLGGGVIFLILLYSHVYLFGAAVI